MGNILMCFPASPPNPRASGSFGLCGCYPHRPAKASVQRFRPIRMNIYITGIRRKCRSRTNLQDHSSGILRIGHRLHRCRGFFRSAPPTAPRPLRPSSRSWRAPVAGTRRRRSACTNPAVCPSMPRHSAVRASRVGRAPRYASFGGGGSRGGHGRRFPRSFSVDGRGMEVKCLRVQVFLLSRRGLVEKTSLKETVIMHCCVTTYVTTTRARSRLRGV